MVLYLIHIERFDKNVIILAADMTSSLHIDNKKKHILSLGECPTNGLDYIH